MNLKQFRELIIDIPKHTFYRHELIGMINSINSDWSYILRAVLICSNEPKMTKHYLLEKVDYMIDNPKRMHTFMDHWRHIIYIQLKDYFKR